MQTTQINLGDYPIGTTYICRDGSEVTITENIMGFNYPYQGSNQCTYTQNAQVFKWEKDEKDIISVKSRSVTTVVVNKPSQYETIMQIASSIQEAGGSVSHLHKITLEDFLSICEKNSIEITVKYNKGK